MNFAQPLGTQHASKIYTGSVSKLITVLFSDDYKIIARNYGLSSPKPSSDLVFYLGDVVNIGV